MPNDTAKNFARCDRGLVVASAGCGKTHLIAESMGHATGRQLVLTHTHAGVDALRTKLTALGISSTKYRIRIVEDADAELRAVPVFYRRQIAQGIRMTPKIRVL